jgi:hypothetical protein
LPVGPLADSVLPPNLNISAAWENDRVPLPPLPPLPTSAGNPAAAAAGRQATAVERPAADAAAAAAAALREPQAVRPAGRPLGAEHQVATDGRSALRRPSRNALTLRCRMASSGRRTASRQLASGPATQSTMSFLSMLGRTARVQLGFGSRKCFV